MKKYLTADRIIICVLFFMTLALMLLTPMIGDDYTYCFIYGTHDLVSSVKDVFISQYNMYHMWGGRSIAIGLYQLLMLVGKPILNLFMALGYTTVIVYLVKNSGVKYKWISYMIAFFMIWFFLPDYGKTVSMGLNHVVYVYPMAIAFVFITPFVSKKKFDTSWKNVLWILLGFLAGWSNEMSAFFVVMFLIYSMIENKILADEKERRNPRCFEWLSLVAVLIGMFIQFRAPGNQVRKISNGDTASIFNPKTLEERVTMVTKLIYDNVLWMYVIAIVLLILFILVSKELIKKVRYSVYLIMSLCCIYAMILSSHIPERTLTTCVIVAVWTIMCLLSELIRIAEKEWLLDGVKQELVKKLVIALFAGLSLVFLFQYYFTFFDTAHLYANNKKRINSIYEQIAEGKSNIILEPIENDNPRCAWEEIKTEPGEWPNIDMAAYYGVDSVAVLEKHCT